MSASGTFTAYLVEPAFEAALEAELGNAPGRSPRWPAVLTRPRGHDGPEDPMFARQVLPEAQLIKAPAPEALVEQVLEASLARVQGAVAGPFVFTPDASRYRALAAAVGPCTQRLKAGLKAAGHKGLPPNPQALRAAFRQGRQVLQVALVGHTSALVSCSVPRACVGGGFDISPWPAGLAPVAQDRQAPSRAYKKLEETFAWLGRAPRAHETVVDLGGAPGGWAWTALKRGAQVTAIDRAPLSPPAAGHPALVQVQGDAFAFSPPAPVDWLLCDVICEPARSLALITRWAREGWCRHLVVTVKFKGATGNHRSVSPIVSVLTTAGFRFARVKHLYNNQNEVEVFASREGDQHG